MNKADVAIIGAGPAGIAATIQLNRYGIKPLIFERDNIGGLLKNANFVENYPGFKNGISGRRLVKILEDQFLDNNPDIVFEEVNNLDYNANRFVINAGESIYSTRTLLISSGTIPNHYPGSISNRALDSGRIFYEIYPVRNVEGKKVAIVGGGDAAFDYALQLSDKNQVKIYHRSSTFNCLPLLFQRTQKNSTIEVNKDYCLESVDLAEDFLNLSWGFPDGKVNTGADYLIFAIGRKPELSYVSASLKNQMPDLEKQGNLHLAGDVINGICRQTAIAAGDGIKAAMNIYFYLSGK